jgi:hypothetical protein
MLLHHVADVARTVEEPSIDHIIEEVVSLGIISGEALKVIRLHNIARSIVFCCVGWISMLFTPVWSEPSAKLSSDFLVFDRSHGPVELISQSQPIGIARSSLGEMMRTFGQLLPCQTAQTSNAGTDAAFASDSFYVSLLNVSTLSNIASIKIKWITHLSSHLRFDKNNRTLSIFALPSFCEVSRTHASDSGNSAPSRYVVLSGRFVSTELTKSSIVESYYDDFTKPTDFSNDALLREITRSYRLIFADDERSRRRYLNHERKRLIKYKMVHDPYLQDCCVGYQPGHRIAPTSYHKKHDFPIFEARLSELQEYVQRQNPSTIKMLWNDQRNFLQWYSAVNVPGRYVSSANNDRVTLWAVVVVGSLGILFAFVQTTLSAVQVYIAANPPKM